MCSNNNLSELNLQSNKNLGYLELSDNKLSTLNISNNTNLTSLLCNDNNLSSLDVSKNTKLEKLWCSYNNLSAIDVSNNKLLDIFNCIHNQRTIQISNDRTFDLSTLPGGFKVSKASNWKGGTVSGTTLKVNEGADKVTYTYDCGNNKTATFVLNVTTAGTSTPDNGTTTPSTPDNGSTTPSAPDNGSTTPSAPDNGSTTPSAPDNGSTVVPNVTVSYRTHVQSIGWQNYVSNGQTAGTSGKAKRLEGINIKVEGNENLGVQYTTHVQSYGWMPWSSNDEMSGTTGEAKRLEAIKIQLTGADKDLYDVYYRVHAQSYGWLGWAKNGAPAGTAIYAKRLEAIQIVVVKKGESINAKMENITSNRSEAYIAKPGTSDSVVNSDEPYVMYQTHVQTYGWQAWKNNGQVSGTTGEAKRLEGINIKLSNKPYSGSIVYTTHVQTYGWQGNINDSSTWKKDGQMAGTSGQAKRLEAICIKLTGEMEKHYDVYYRVHAQTYGWLGWAKNGAPSGTAGYGKRLEGIQIVLVPKGSSAPPSNYGNVTSNRKEAYIAR